MENNNIFDMNKALEQTGGDRELLEEIIAIYRHEYPEQLLQIQEGIKKNDTLVVREVAHTVKGAVANFGAKPAFEAALNLENIGKSGNLSDARGAYDRLRKELNLLDQELQKI